MLSKINNSILLKVFFAFSFLIIATVILILFIQTNSINTLRLNQEKSELSGLANDLESVHRSSEIYRSNAARDYESYFRDLDVYYKVINQMLLTIDKKVERLKSTKLFLDNLSKSFNYQIIGSGANELIQQINLTEEQWQLFRQELQRQFGEKIDEPRLEWGADYIVNNSPSMITQFQSLIITFDKITELQSNQVKTSGSIVVGLLLVFTSAFAVFFYWQIILPIQTTKQAFLRVSEGDFGHQVQAKRNDEIGQLVESFNHMSARSNTVLQIISKLQSVATSEDVIDILYKELKSYLNLDLVLLAKKNRSQLGYQFGYLTPQSQFKNLFKVNTQLENKAHEDYMSKLVRQGNSTQIDNIEQFLRLYPNAVVLHTLISRYPLKSAIVQPLPASLDDSILIFASYHEGQLNEKHQELINHLMPFINHKFMDVESRKIADTAYPLKQSVAT